MSNLISENAKSWAEQMLSIPMDQLPAELYHSILYAIYYEEDIEKVKAHIRTVNEFIVQSSMK